MAKSNAERQKLYRLNLSKNKPKYEQTREKSRLRDNLRRQRLKGVSLQELRTRQKQTSKKYRDAKKLNGLNSNKRTYKSRQSFGKAVKRVIQSLPKDAERRVIVVQHLAQELCIIPKATSQHAREQRSLPIELQELVVKFYNRDDVSYQLPGKRDCVTFKNHDGLSMTLQKRILLYNIRETHQLFLMEHTEEKNNLSLTSFNELRPSNILVQSKMPHRSCLCVYHENVNLLLKPLSRYIRCAGLRSLQDFSAMLVCDEQKEECMFRRCQACGNNFREKVLKAVTNRTQELHWFQWVADDGKTKKIEFDGTIDQCLTTLSNKLEPFLIHVFIKRRQAAFFEELKNVSTPHVVCVQVDYSENFRLATQDAVQSSYYSQDAVSLFTSYVWYSGGGQSCVYASNNLTHDKYCVNASLENLLDRLKQQFTGLREVHVFSDGSTQQFKQKFLFRNICRLSEKYQVELHWHYFATSHGKGIVDALGGTVKRLVHRGILSGEQCKSASEFVRVARSKTTTIDVIELTQSQIDASKLQLEQLYQTTKSVPETKKIHSVKALDDKSIEYRYYSNSATKKTFRFSD